MNKEEQKTDELIKEVEPETEKEKDKDKGKQNKTGDKAYKKAFLKRFLFILVGVALLSFIGYFAYKHYDNTKPLGVDKSVETTHGVVEADPSLESIMIKADGGSVSIGEQRLLFAESLTPLENGHDEFTKSELLRSNLINLAASGDYEDYRKAAVYWTRVSDYNAFTTKENLLTMAIGHDVLSVYNHYEVFKNFDKQGWIAVEKELAKKLENAKSPFILAIATAQFSVVGLNETVIDDNSVILSGDERIEFKGSRRFDSAKEARALAKLIELYPQKTFNKTASAWDPQVNAVYEVELLVDGRPFISVIREGIDGKLSVYGQYYEHKQQKDAFLRPYRLLTEAGVRGSGRIDPNSVDYNVLRYYLGER